MYSLSFVSPACRYVTAHLTEASRRFENQAARTHDINCRTCYVSAMLGWLEDRIWILKGEYRRTLMDAFIAFLSLGVRTIFDAFIC